MVHGKGAQFDSAVAGISLIREEVYDEFVVPFVVAGRWSTSIEIKSAILLSSTSVQTGLGTALFNPAFEGLTGRRLSKRLLTPWPSLYDRWNLSRDCLQEGWPQNTIGEVLANNGKQQLRIAETEKYPHVTFFRVVAVTWEFQGEDRIWSHLLRLKPLRNVCLWSQGMP